MGRTADVGRSNAGPGPVFSCFWTCARRSQNCTFHQSAPTGLPGFLELAARPFCPTALCPSTSTVEGCSSKVGECFSASNTSESQSTPDSNKYLQNVKTVFYGLNGEHCILLNLCCSTWWDYVGVLLFGFSWSCDTGFRADGCLLHGALRPVPPKPRWSVDRSRFVRRIHGPPPQQRGGVGHHSPIGAYDETTDRVLVLDVARRQAGDWRWKESPQKETANEA